MAYEDRELRHLQLMNRMADLNGADLTLAEQVGLLTPEEYHGAARSCMGCAAVETCETQLHADQPGLPDFCRNRDMIARLADEMESLGMSLN